MPNESEPRGVGKPLGPIEPGRRPKLARELIAARLARGLSQAAAADECGCSPSEWARWERGKVPGLRIYRMVLAAWVAGEWPTRAAREAR